MRQKRKNYYQYSENERFLHIWEMCTCIIKTAPFRENSFLKTRGHSAKHLTSTPQNQSRS